jgi:hypothetical protein
MKFRNLVLNYAHLWKTHNPESTGNQHFGENFNLKKRRSEWMFLFLFSCVCKASRICAFSKPIHRGYELKFWRHFFHEVIEGKLSRDAYLILPFEEKYCFSNSVFVAFRRVWWFFFWVFMLSKFWTEFIATCFWSWIRFIYET